MIALRDAAFRNFGKLSYDTLHAINEIIPTALQFENSTLAALENFEYKKLNDQKIIFEPDNFYVSSKFSKFIIAFYCKRSEFFIYKSIENQNIVTFKGGMKDLEGGDWKYPLNSNFNKSVIKNIKTIIYLIEFHAQIILIRDILKGQCIPFGRNANGEKSEIPKSVFSNYNIENLEEESSIDWKNNTISNRKAQWSDVEIKIRKIPYTLDKYVKESGARWVEAELLRRMNGAPEHPCRKVELIREFRNSFPVLSRHSLDSIWRSAISSHRILHPDTRWSHPGKKPKD